MHSESYFAKGSSTQHLTSSVKLSCRLRWLPLLIEVFDNDIETSIHHFGVIVLQCIHIQLENGLLIQVLGNDQITQILQQLLTAEGIGLRVEGVVVGFCDFILN